MLQNDFSDKLIISSAVNIIDSKEDMTPWTSIDK
jgi:hypothetical protein